ncbi:plasmid recombination protein, partial [Enterococcus faecalis]|uniref:plasmid recombination protein n=1 Tax=Enterococcus faecalis TaxID=1351 RepID=UPI003ED9A1B0
MAHVQKFTKGAVGGLSSHIERKTLNHSNKYIDVDRTEKNYYLCDKDCDMNARLSER